MTDQHETTIYPTTDDHGDRFERMWEAYHQYDLPAYVAPLVGALLGLVAAVVIATLGAL